MPITEDETSEARDLTVTEDSAREEVDHAMEQIAMAAQNQGVSHEIVPVGSDEAVEVEGTENKTAEDSSGTLPLKPLPEEIAAGLEFGESAGKRQRPPSIRAIQRCHVGYVRSRNEDAAYYFQTDTGGQEPLMPFGLYVVADGMGGHYAGHEASKNVSRLVASHILERTYLPLLLSSTAVGGAPPDPIRDVMLDAVQQANLAIHNPDPEKDSGTTLTAALILGRRLYIAHVGDSRAYLLNGDELRLVTTDHSFVRRLQEAGQLSEEEAASHPQRNMLYMAVGQGGDLEIDTFTQSLPDKGKLVLCSDGLWGLVPEPLMQQVLKQDIPLKEMADDLVGLALQAGGYDNITVVLVDFNL